VNFPSLAASQRYGDPVESRCSCGGSDEVEPVGTVEASVGRNGGGDCLFRDRQWPSVLLELIGLISLLPRVSGVRRDLWFWSSLGILRERLSSSELIHHVLN
jgi:hypothetical protein